MRLWRNQAGQEARVTDGVRIPVVVEVSEGGPFVGPVPNSPCPLVDLAVRIVAVAPPLAAVEADEREVGRELVRLERPFGVIADNERDVVPAQQLVDVVVEPARVAEL